MCTNDHQFVYVYSDYVKLINKLCLHKSTAVNCKIFVWSHLSLILYDKTITAQAIMDDICEKDMALKNDVSHNHMYLKSCQATEGDNSGSKKRSLVIF